MKNNKSLSLQINKVPMCCDVLSVVLLVICIILLASKKKVVVPEPTKLNFLTPKLLSAILKRFYIFMFIY